MCACVHSALYAVVNIVTLETVDAPLRVSASFINVMGSIIFFAGINTPLNAVTETRDGCPNEVTSTVF